MGMNTLCSTAVTNAAALLRWLSNFSPPPSSWLGRGLALVRKLGPYAVIELLLPGGTVVIVVLWLYRRYKASRMASNAVVGYA